MKRQHDQIRSSVVIPIETRSRNEAIDELKKAENQQDVARNRRIFGTVLMGTLDKFRREQTTNAQAKKLNEIDKRLEKTKEEDRERAFQQKQELLAKRREEEVEFKRQRKIRAIEDNAKTKEEHFKRLQKFVQTQAKPPIFWKPAKHTPETEKMMEESAKSIEVLIQKLKEDTKRQLDGTAVEEDHLPSSRLASRVVAANDKSESPPANENTVSANGREGSHNSESSSSSQSP